MAATSITSQPVISTNELQTMFFGIQELHEQLLKLEDLYKPVARLQINALVLQDLINEIPTTHADYKLFIQSRKTMHKLLMEFNVKVSKTFSYQAMTLFYVVQVLQP